MALEIPRVRSGNDFLGCTGQGKEIVDQAKNAIERADIQVKLRMLGIYSQSWFGW